MKEQITIKVERRSDNPQKPFITLFERIIDSDSSVSVPYQTLLDAFRFVYGNYVNISVCSTIII